MRHEGVAPRARPSRATRLLDAGALRSKTGCIPGRRSRFPYPLEPRRPAGYAFASAEHRRRRLRVDHNRCRALGHRATWIRKDRSNAGDKLREDVAQLRPGHHPASLVQSSHWLASLVLASWSCGRLLSFTQDSIIERCAKIAELETSKAVPTPKKNGRRGAGRFVHPMTDRVRRFFPRARPALDGRRDRARRDRDLYSPCRYDPAHAASGCWWSAPR